MKKLLKIVFFLLAPVIVNAQQDPFVEMWSDKQIDSLRDEWKHTGANDTIRMRIARSLGWHYQEINRDSSLYFQSVQLELARKLKLKLWEADALDQGGWVLAQLKNYPLSLQYFLDGFDILQNKDCEKNIWLISLFSKDKDPEKARLTCLASIYNDISTLYAATGNRGKELFNLMQGLRIAQRINNYTMISLITLNTAGLYLRLDKPDSALMYIKASQDHMIRSGYKTYEGEALNTLGTIFTKKKDYNLAKDYYDQSILANIKNNVKTGIPNTFLSLANMFLALGKNDSVIYYIREAINMFREVKNYTDLSRAYAFMYTVQKKVANRDSTYYFLQLYTVLNDSLNRAEKEKIDAYQNVGFNQQIEMQHQEKNQIQKANKTRTYALLSGIGIFMLIAFLLYRNNRNRRNANALLQKQKEEIEVQKINVEQTLTELKSTQAQLIQSEKMASLGELTAGIAHEIQNPLNFVNNFSEVNKELIDEIIVDRRKKIEERSDKLQDELIDNIKENEEKINHHGNRAADIVKGMLQHSRSSSGVKEPTDINALCDEYLRLSYHGLRAKDKNFNATMKTDFDETIGNINIIPQDIGRVVLNLINNAFYAVHEKHLNYSAAVVDEKKKSGIENYEPTVSVSTKKEKDKIEISVKDNGSGIPDKVVDKIFQPFFTTKPTGQGTGLGLSLAYDIVKAHSGTISINTNIESGTEFIIHLPIKS